MKERIKRLWNSRIGVGVLASYLNTGVGIACNLVVVPIYLKYLGGEEFGLWIAISGIVAYMGLLNLGISQTAANYFGSAVARKDPLEQNRVLATGFWFYVSIVGSALVLVNLLGPWLPWHSLVRDSVNLSQKTRSIFVAASACFLIELPLTLFPACLRSMGRIHLQQTLAAIQNLARLIVAFTCLALGGTVVGLIVALSCTNVVIYLSSFFIIKRELPALCFRLRYFDKALRREMTTPSFFYLVLQISATIAFSTDAVVIAAMLGPGQVTPYALAQKIAFMALSAVTAISTNFGPSFLVAYSHRAFHDLKRLFKKAMLLSVGIGSLVSIGLLVIGPFLIPLWVGEKNYVGLFPYMMIVGLVFLQMVLTPCDSLLQVTGNHKGYALFALWEAILNLGLSILLAPRFGVGGVAMGTLIARVFGSGPVMLWKSFRIIRTPQAESSWADVGGKLVARQHEGA